MQAWHSIAAELGSMRSFKVLLLAGWLAIAAVLSGCARFAEWVRQYTYPPNFNYITTEQLRSTMWLLAKDVRELEERVRRPGEFNEVQRAQIISLLASMEDNAASLSRSSLTSNHWIIDVNLPAFRQEVNLARRQVEHDPPSYKLVALLPGACLRCHGKE